MAQNKLFDIKDGKATITNHCYTISYLKDIIDTYGEKIAVKIFTVFQYMSDLNPETNPLANIAEDEKLETVVRACASDLPLTIDWNDDIFVEGIELTRKLFETPTYRAYLSVKTLRDNMIKTLGNAHTSVSKDDGNTAELTRGLSMLETLNEAAKKAYSEFEAENGSVQRKGGRKAVTRTIGGKAIELE
jgi:hypothetical protein